MIHSETLKGFLDFLREAAEQEHMATSDEQLASDETQDILHRLELNDDSYGVTLALAFALRTVRRRRRTAKDEAALAKLVNDWAADHQQAVHGLDKLLSDMRKLEANNKQRFYGERTNVLDFLKEEENESSTFLIEPKQPQDGQNERKEPP